jgi:aminopeptidase
MDQFINECRMYLSRLRKIADRQNARQWAGLTPDKLREENRFVHQWQLSYDESLMNPERSGPGRAALATLCFGLKQQSYRGMIEPLDSLDQLLNQYSGAVLSEEEAIRIIQSFHHDRIQKEAEDLFRQEWISDFHLSVLNDFDAGDPSILYRYGLYVSPVEEEMFSFLSEYDETALDRFAHTVVEAFLHGFVSQNRKRRDRTRVRLLFQAGQEPFIRKLLQVFRGEGLMLRPYRVECSSTFPQIALDHRIDETLYLDDAYLKEFSAAYTHVCDRKQDLLRDECGLVGLIQFGGSPEIPRISGDGLKASKDDLKSLSRYRSLLREISGRYVKADDISFCKAAFPNPAVGEEFPRIFDDFMDINTMDSRRYEKLQQILIDVLDKGREVLVRGAPGNDTDIRISLQPLLRPESQSNFLNCGGDLNIPHGEVFTTPELARTEGTLHFRNIRLRDNSYRDLRIHFSQGRTDRWSCGNFSDPDEGAAYVRDTLFFPHATVAMGEFSIGTNTKAYTLVRRHKLLEQLPILLVEKMGPHFAIGDPCYARGEGSPVYNLLDGKEVTPRWNEESRNGIYADLHVDMTLPYEDTGLIRVITGEGVTIDIIRDGLFVLPGLEELNDPFLEGENLYES